MGTLQCPLDISVLWTADVDSPVYSTPVLIPSPSGAGKQIVVATLRNAVELLEGDGSTPPLWPIEMNGVAFHASPAVHDVNGDGILDFCVADIHGSIAWLSPGDQGPFLQEYNGWVMPREVEKSDWYASVEDPGNIDAHGLENNEEPAGESSRRNNIAATDQQDPKFSRFVQNVEGGSREGTPEGDPRLPGKRRLLGAMDDESAMDVADVNPDVDQEPEYTGTDLDDEFATEFYGTGPFDDYWDWGSERGWDNQTDAPEEQDDGNLFVDGHNLAAPVFVDVDGDRSKEMIVPVSYFFDTAAAARYAASAPKNLRPENYVSAALACWSFKGNNWVWTAYLGQTTSGSQKKGYVYASPTVTDLDGDGMLDIAVGTTLGHVHVLDGGSGKNRAGFPVTGYDAIKGQVAVADAGEGDELELLFGDVSGLLVCLNADGNELWRSQLPGAITDTVMLGDIDGDGQLDVVAAVTTAEGEGQVWAVHAIDGLTLANFPVKLGNRKGISAPILLVDLHEKTAGKMGGAYSTGRSSRTKPYSKDSGVVPLGGAGPGVHLLAPSEDGHVYVIEGATGCVNKIDLGERVLSMVLADDVKGDGTLDLIVGTMTGEVLALSTNLPYHPLNAWSSPARGYLNGFVHGNFQGVYFVGPRGKYEHIIGREFPVEFEIVDRRPGANQINRYQVSIWAGSRCIFSKSYTMARRYEENLTLGAPVHTLLRLEMTNSHHQVFEDVVSVGYNTGFYATLKWILAAPVALAAMPFWWLSQPGAVGRGSLPS